MAPEQKGGSITIPFDSGDAGRFQLEVYPDQVESGDGVVLALDREACRSFARVFSQLAEDDYPEGFHVHLGWSEEDSFGPGLRVVLTERGRIVE
ncbi:MAG: hypothetical protein AAFX85_12475 [Pseudomonadota bacterium]